MTTNGNGIGNNNELDDNNGNGDDNGGMDNFDNNGTPHTTQ